jgi:hypothetical protein
MEINALQILEIYFFGDCWVGVLPKARLFDKKDFEKDFELLKRWMSGGGGLRAVRGARFCKTIEFSSLCGVTPP